MTRFGRWILLVAGGSPLLWSQSPAQVPSHVIVTAGHYYSHQPPALSSEDLEVTQQFEQRTITRLLPLQGTRSALELYILIDDCSSCEAATKFDELRRFVIAQPASTAIGVAYIRAGQLEVIQKPSEDRDEVAAQLHPVSGGKPASPYVALTGLIKKWVHDPGRNPQARRAILMLSNGIDPGAPNGIPDPSAEAAIEAAQLGDVTIFALYHPSADYVTTDPAKIYAGQVQLAHVANESGGEAYLMGFGPLPSLAPFLADVADHLANQYRLEFLATPEDPAGSLVNISIQCKQSGVELMAPTRAWVPGTGVLAKGQ